MSTVSRAVPYTEPWLRGTRTDVPVVARAVLHSFELAGDDAQGEVLTFVVSFEFVGVARLSPGPFYVGPNDRLAFRGLRTQRPRSVSLFASGER